MSELHTPGPWAVQPQSREWFLQTNHANRVVSGNHPTHFVASVEGWGDNSESNARLIAAAPDLLAALKLVESVYRQNVVAVGEPSSVLDAMQAAIAKAEGVA